MNCPNNNSCTAYVGKENNNCLCKKDDLCMQANDCEYCNNKNECDSLMKNKLDAVNYIQACSLQNIFLAIQMIEDLHNIHKDYKIGNIFIEYKNDRYSAIINLKKINK